VPVNDKCSHWLHLTVFAKMTESPPQKTGFLSNSSVLLGSLFCVFSLTATATLATSATYRVVFLFLNAYTVSTVASVATVAVAACCFLPFQ